MNCPVCAIPLAQKSVAGVTLDVCDQGCGGIWFDQFEFKKFDEKSEPDPVAVLNLNPPARKTGAAATQAAELFNCPKCKSAKMMRHFASVKHQVVMDECPVCASVWLDAGELRQIREEFNTEDDRKAAAATLFSEMFDDKLKAEHNKSPSQSHEVQAFANAFKYLAPSYYLKKK